MIDESDLYNSTHAQLVGVLIDIAGVSPHTVVVDPIAALKKLLDARADKDWRDALMAAIAGGRNIADATMLATLAVHRLAKHRAERADE